MVLCLLWKILCMWQQEPDHHMVAMVISVWWIIFCLMNSHHAVMQLSHQHYSWYISDHTNNTNNKTPEKLLLHSNWWKTRNPLKAPLESPSLSLVTCCNYTMNSAVYAGLYLAVTVVSISSHEVDSVAVFIPEGSLIGQGTVGDSYVVIVVIGGEWTTVMVGHRVTCKMKGEL